MQPHVEPEIGSCRVFEADIDGSVGLFVDSRDLCEFLQVTNRHVQWIVRRLKAYRLRPLVEVFTGQEFFTKVRKTSPREIVQAVVGKQDGSASDAAGPGGRPSKVFILSLEGAKILSMVERTDRGDQVRRYFLAVEAAFLKLREVEAARYFAARSPAPVAGNSTRVASRPPEMVLSLFEFLQLAGVRRSRLC